MDYEKKGYTALVAVSLDYRTDSDFNATNKNPTARLAEIEKLTTI